MTDFNDVNGKPITPGCIAVVGVKQNYGGVILRRGLVTRTSIRYIWNGEYRPRITLRNESTKAYIGTYSSPKAFMIVG